jgi:GNAT superfamily N-acetyltransferase
MEGNTPIKFELKKDPIFREKKEPQIEVLETGFSDEQDNENNTNGEGGEKTFSLINKDNNEVIGSMYYDYPKDVSINIAKVRLAGLEEKYRGQSFGPKLYEHLIEIAKNKGLDGIGSDSVVQGGGIVVWKKLMDIGHQVIVNPSIKEQWNHFNEMYGEGKLFKEKINVEKEDSVFKILF